MLIGLTPINTTGHLKPFPIGSFRKMFTLVANNNVSENVEPQTCIEDFISYTLSNWFSKNDRIFILTNREFILMG